MAVGTAGCGVGRARIVAGFVALGLSGCLVLSGCGGGQPPKKPKKPSAPSGSAKSAFDRGKQFLTDGSRQKAVAAFNEAIRATPDYQQAYVWRGVAHSESGDSNKAIADFSKAIELDPEDNYAMEQRAALYRAAGETAKAKADEDRAEEIRVKYRDDLRQRIKGKKQPDK